MLIKLLVKGLRNLLHRIQWELVNQLDNHRALTTLIGFTLLLHFSHQLLVLPLGLFGLLFTVVLVDVGFE